jgi:WD40 repeat protein
MIGLSLGENELYLWDLATGKMRQTLSPQPGVSAVRFYPTAEHVISVSNEAIKLWSICENSGPPLLRESEPLRRLAFTKDGTRIITETAFRRFGSIWSVAESRRIHQFGPDLRNLTFASDTNVIAASLENDVVLYSAISGERIRSLEAHTRPIRACHIAESGALVASGDGHPDDQAGTAEAILWDAKSGRLLHRMPGHYGSIALAIAPDERTLVTVDREQVLRIWDVFTGKLMLKSKSLAPSWSTWGVQRLVFSRDGQTLYACSGGAVHAVDPVTGMLRHQLADGTVRIGDLCVSPDGRTLAVARGSWAEHDSDEGVVELWDLASGELKASLAKEYGSAICVAFSPDGRTLASGHRNGKIVCWRAATEDEVDRQVPY